MHIKFGDEAGKKKLSDQRAQKVWNAKVIFGINGFSLVYSSFLSAFFGIRLSCAYFDQNITLAVVSNGVVRINRLNLLYIWIVMYVDRQREKMLCYWSRWMEECGSSGEVEQFFVYMTVSQVECSVLSTHSHPIHTNNNNLMIRLL